MHGHLFTAVHNQVKMFSCQLIIEGDFVLTESCKLILVCQIICPPYLFVSAGPMIVTGGV